ncbi:MAG: metal ABC transporter substrate-binding protein [Mariniblastus sp.]|nr:metal ABC transporter substrate-binding protein [Mariniblastus sp.]
MLHRQETFRDFAWKSKPSPRLNLVVGLCLLASLLTGCSEREVTTGTPPTNRPAADVADRPTPSHSADKKLIVCSTTQCADFARQVVGDRWDVHSVLGPGQDPHSYEPRVADSDAVAKADLCIRNGWNLEGHEWMKTLASNAGKPLVTCTDEVEPLMTGDDSPVQDPHAWFNTANAWKYVKQIRDEVCRLDPEHADEYRARAELYRAQLRDLENWIQQQVGAIAGPRVLVTHHDAFGYFCDRYGFEPVSPVGWTTDEIAGTTISDRQAVVDQIRNLKVRSIFVETTLNREMIEAIAREAGVDVGGELYSDAMGGPGTAGESYIGMMRENVLKIVAGLK